MKLQVLGSGTPKPSLSRAGSGYLVEVGEDRILFDHGFGAGRRLLELGVSPQSITHVFLSHHHYDHIGDLAQLILTRWDQQRDTHPELRIFGPPPIEAIVGRLVGRDGAFSTDLAARINSPCSRDLYAVRGGKGERRWPEPEVTTLRPGDCVAGDGWTVSCATAIHCPGDLECLGFRIEAGGRSIVYTGDTGPSEPLVRLARGCDILLHMCSQSSGRIATPAIAESSIGHREVAKAAADAGAKTLVLTHIQHLEDPDLRHHTLTEIREIYGGEVLIAEDLMSFELDGVGAG